MTVLDRVRSFVHQHDLIRRGTRVLAAVSGGSDSMALAHVLAELDRAGDVHLAGIVHFNHQLRDEAGRDEEFVRSAARALNVPFSADTEDIRARARRERRSIEDAARAARYEFFDRARAAFAADAVALGHTRDDQAETFMLRLIRGAGPRGLSGMHPRNGAIIRPLLDCTRSELRAWLQERNIAHVEDVSNTDTTVPRNRVRAELMPLLAARFNPRIVDVLADEAALARELWQWMHDASAPFLAVPGELDRRALLDAAPALRRLVIWRAMSRASGGAHISFDHVAAVIRLITGERADGRLDLPGHAVQRIGDRVVLTTERDSEPRHPKHSREANLFSCALSIPGEARIPQAGFIVSAENGSADRTGIDGGGAMVGKGPVALVRRELCGESLVVRNRRPGDKFRPVGLRGRKKLQDLFVDAKLPRADRDSVPVVVDEQGRIVWVAGFGIDESFRVTDASQAVLVLRLTRG